MLEPGPGTLLVASAELLDPTFAESVILLIDVDPSGALGVVLNRPSPVGVEDVLEGWGDLASAPEVLFMGGPVSADGALALARCADLPPGVGFQPIFAGLGLVDLDTEPPLLDGRLLGLRIFAGYAGWGAGQLDAEVAEGSWHVVAAEAGDVFGEATADLRREVLRRQPGELAWLSTRPADPAAN